MFGSVEIPSIGLPEKDSNRNALLSRENLPESGRQGISPALQ
jgi:hypothetical protein